MKELDDYDCIRCGACCVATIETEDYVFMRQEDVDRLSPDEQERLVLRTDVPTYGAQFAMRTTEVGGERRCAALQGRVGCSVSCSIYDRRPNACRRFPKESVMCDAARQFVLGISLK